MKKIRNIFLLLSMIFLYSCEKKHEVVETEAPKETATTAPSADANAGGVGFEAVAESLGYQTNAGKNYATEPTQKGGVWHDYLEAYPSVFRPYGPDANTVDIQTITSLVYGDYTLVSMNYETGKFERGMADYWKFSDDGRTAWFRLNPNIKFSDGTPLTVDDIIATHNLLIDTELADPYYNENEARYTLTKESDHILKVEVQKDEWKNWLTFEKLVFPASHLSKVDTKTYLTRYAGEFMPSLGPYVFDKEKSKAQELIVLKKNPNWYGYLYEENKNLYNFDTLEFRIMVEQKIIREAFKKGELDYYFPDTPEWYGEFKKQGTEFDPLKRNLMLKRVVFNNAPKGRSFWVFNTRKKPFDNLNVRKAIAVALNKDIIIEKIYHNDMVKTYSTVPFSKYESPEIEHYTYDPKRASDLLDQAGYNIPDADGTRKNAAGERLEFDLFFYSGSETNEQMHTMLQQDLKAVGIKANLQKIDWSNMVKQLDDRSFNMLALSFSGIPFPDPEQEFESKRADDANSNNISGFKNPEADKLIEEYNLEHDINKRYVIAQKIDKLVADNVSFIDRWTAPYTERFIFWNEFKTAGAYDSESRIRYWSYDADKQAQLEKAKTDTSITMEEGDLIIDRYGFKPADFSVTEY